jgi:hypothetical protein
VEREKSGGEGRERESESERDERQQLTHSESLPGDGKPGNKTLDKSNRAPLWNRQRETDRTGQTGQYTDY